MIGHDMVLRKQERPCLTFGEAPGLGGVQEE